MNHSKPKLKWHKIKAYDEPYITQCFTKVQSATVYDAKTGACIMIEITLSTVIYSEA